MRNVSLLVLTWVSMFSACSVAHVGPGAEDAGPRSDARPSADAGGSDAPAPVDAPPSDDAGGIDAPPSADDGGGSDAGCPPDDDAAPSARFLALHEAIIRPGCVGAGRFCHEGAYEGFAMLTPELALSNLVNVRGCGETRVVPCRPEESYASWVIRNGGEPCGRPFPPISGGGAGHPTFSDGYFSEADVVEIESWIRAGAH